MSPLFQRRYSSLQLPFVSLRWSRDLANGKGVGQAGEVGLIEDEANVGGGEIVWSHLDRGVC